MDMFQLRCFLQLTKTGNGSVAGEQLGVAQSTVSKAITSLETELRVKLFDRVGRRLVINEHGKLFREHALVALKSLNEGSTLMKRLQNETLGSVAIDAFAFNCLLSDCVAAYAKENPWVNIAFHSKRTEKSGRDREICDIALTYIMGGDYNGSVYYPVIRKMFQEEFVVVFSPNLYQAAPENKSITMDDLRDLPFVVMNQPMEYDDIAFKHTRSFGDPLDIVPKQLFEVDDLMLKLALVSRGLGAAFLPESTLSYARIFDPDLCIMHLENYDLKRTVCIGRRRKAHLSTAALSFWNFILQFYNLPEDNEE